MQKNISQLFDLSGKTAIVTGGAMGIGQGIAQRLADAGANILVVDRASEAEAENCLKSIKEKGGKVEYFQADLAETRNYQKIFEKVQNTFGDLHILVNNAGVYRYMPILDMTEEMWDQTIAINLKAVAFLSKEAIKLMIEKKHGGRIINISSIDSIKPTGNLLHYDASKGGVRMLTRSLAKEAGKYGITVNDIAPGGVNTPGTKKIMGENVSPEQMEALQKQTSQFVQNLPLQRMGEPEDIANVVLFIASDASAYMTGSNIVVDGGLLLM